MAILKRLMISGYKSIEHADIELRPLNVLIGANGAGKSNLLSFFKLIYEMRQGRLQRFVADWGADALLFYGAKTTQCLDTTFCLYQDGLGDFTYRVRFNSTPRASSLTLHEEWPFAPDETIQVPEAHVQRGGGGILLESQLNAHIDIWRRDPTQASQAAANAGEALVQNMQKWGIFHFSDTSSNAAIRRRCYKDDNLKLHSDGSNLSAILYKLQKPHATEYHRIIETIRQIAPWFGNYVLQPIKPNETDVLLDWQDRHSDHVFGPHQLPDGALRAMALITLLLQPEEDLPSLIVIDEPELGLHPAAIIVIGALLKAASLHSQIIIATQSVTLLEEFDAGDVIVVDREDGRSTFTRQDPERLKEWLEEYTIGELWQKNSIGGGPF